MLQVVPSVLLYSKKGRNVQDIISEVRNSLTMNCAVLLPYAFPPGEQNKIQTLILQGVKTVLSPNDRA